MMEIHVTEQDCFLVQRAAEAEELTDAEVCELAVQAFRKREQPRTSLRIAAARLLFCLLHSRGRARRLEQYLLRKAAEHGFESEAAEVLYGDAL